MNITVPDATKEWKPTNTVQKPSLPVIKSIPIVEKGELEKLFSTFAMKGDSSSADRFLSSRESGGHSHSSGCGCFGSASCPADSVRSKYGLD